MRLQTRDSNYFISLECYFKEDFVTLLEDAFHESVYDQFPLNKEGLAELAEEYLNMPMDEAVLLFLYHNKDGLVGFLVGQTNSMFTKLIGKRVASQILWYVSPTHRKGLIAFDLFKNFENWAEGNDCSVVTAGSMQNQLTHVFERKGYTQMETILVKELNNGS